MHEAVRESKVLATGSDRSFGFVMAGLCMVIACWPLLRGGALRPVFLAGAALLALVALAVPQILGPANRFWMWLSHVISRIMNPVVMAVIFFGVITPIALLMRLTGKRTLPLAPDAGASSYWTVRDAADGAPTGRIF